MRNVSHDISACEADYWRSLPLDRLWLILKAERKRGVEGHWDYDLPRHRAMIEVYKQRKEQEDHVP